MKPLLQTVIIFGITCGMSISVFATPIGNSAAWATSGITKAYETGLVPSYLTGQATDNISRKDFALLATQFYTKITGKEALPETSTPFADVDLPALTFAYEKGIISGRTATGFYPEQTITREQMAIIIDRTLQAASVPSANASTPMPFVDISTLSETSKEAIQQLYAAKISNGFEGYFYPQKAVSKQEAILAFLNAYEYSNTVLVKLADTTETPSSKTSTEPPTAPIAEPTTAPTVEPTTAPKTEKSEQLNTSKSNKIAEMSLVEQAEIESGITIGNKSIAIGQTAREVRQVAGVPDRIDQDSFGFERYVYLNGHADLFFVSLDKNQKVVEIYTGSDHFEYMGIKGTDSKKNITEIKFDDKRKYRVELPTVSLNSYILLDHEEGIEGILLQDKSMQGLIDKRYNQAFEKSIVRELLDLMNQARARQGQPVMTWDVTAAAVAYKHSFNMSKNSFVEYNDNTGKTPFDRMTEGGLMYTMAAELAGKYEGDAINVYHEWMRTIGTRSNVLNGSLTHGGAGIFMDNYTMYVTADLFKP